MPKPPANTRELSALIEIVAALRGPEGCPWDLEQTHKSLAPFAIEEAFELAEAIESGDDDELKSELGDVLFQVVLHSQLASEGDRFTVEDVIQVLSEKMIRRHPHVFGDVKVAGAADVVANWQQIKAVEKAGKPRRVLETPKGLPALMEAKKIGKKTQNVGFDWPDVDGVLAKVKEEMAEVEEALTAHLKAAKFQNAKSETTPSKFESTKNELATEIGDALFSLAQLARHVGIEPEQALRETNQRFRRRFSFMLDQVDGSEEAFSALAPEEKERLWTLAKRA